MMDERKGGGLFTRWIELATNTTRGASSSATTTIRTRGTEEAAGVISRRRTAPTTEYHNSQSTVNGGELSTTANALAGGLAGALTRTCIAPLDVVKIRWQIQREPSAHVLYQNTVRTTKYASVFQTLRTITKEEGFQGLWKGNLLAEGFWICAMGMQFAAYHKTRNALENLIGSGPSFCQEHLNCRGTTLSLLGGAVAGLNASLIAYPLDMLHTRFAAQTEPKIYPNIRAAINTIYQGQGVGGFYRGLAPTLAQVVPFISLQFGVYENMKAVVAEKDRNNSTTHAFCGTASGAIAKTIVMPLDAAKKRMQICGFVHHCNYKGTVDCIKKIFAKEGARGLYVGTWPSLLKSGLQAGLSFVFYEKIVALFGGNKPQ